MLIDVTRHLPFVKMVERVIRVIMEYIVVDVQHNIRVNSVNNRSVRNFLRIEILMRTSVLFICLAICASAPCLNNGTCLALNSNTQYACMCQPGYTGERCRKLDQQEKSSRSIEKCL